LGVPMSAMSAMSRDYGDAGDHPISSASSVPLCFTVLFFLSAFIRVNPR
jgi:hypothetical protein